MKKRNYQPKKGLSRVEQSKRIEKLRKDVDYHGKTIDAISKSHDNHISYLGNFARHDIKNAMLSMDSIVSTTEAHEFTSEKIESLTTYIEMVMETIDNFAKLIPYNSKGTFTIKSLMVAVELLSRSDMKKNNICFQLDFDRRNENEIDYPFQSILQMLNNLILNSINSLEGILEKRILLSCKINDESLLLNLRDNGVEIPEINLDKIFDYGFSTTGGSGIGLHHARYLCNGFSGEINLENQVSENYTKSFLIKLPCKRQQ